MMYYDYNENKKHGSDSFPIEYYLVNQQHLQYNMPLHWHQEFEIIRVKSGELQLFIDNVKYDLQSGDFAFIGCCSLHRATPKNCIYECLVLDLNMLRKKGNIIDSYIMPLINSTVTVCSVYHNNNDILSASLNALFDVFISKNTFYELSVFSLLYRIIFNLHSEGLISKTNKKVVNQHQIQIMTELLDWIDTHSRETIFIKDLAKISGFSEKYLCRFFKEYTTKTPIEYINHLRIENACHEIAHQGLSITEAAFKSGFNNLNYFSKTFKKQMNITPREYKSRYLNR